MALSMESKENYNGTKTPLDYGGNYRGIEFRPNNREYHITRKITEKQSTPYKMTKTTTEKQKQNVARKVTGDKILSR